jgi:hypothetical protein
MTELAVPTPQTDTPARLDSWVEVVAPVAKLAGMISNTPFVPDAFRGQPEAVAAAILTGRELGIPPLQSLRQIHIIKGKPGLSAELMRALVLRSGHSIEVIDSTDTRAVVRGRRRDGDWQEARFTADEAKRAQINLGGYPADKLVARASTRLCRRMFPDVIGGLPAVDELEDTRADSTPTHSAPSRTVQRRASAPPLPPPNRLLEATVDGSPAVPLNDPPADDGPPLDEDDDSKALKLVVDGSAGSLPVPPVTETGEAITGPQKRMLMALLNGQGLKEHDARMAWLGGVVGREVSSTNDLTVTEASTAIDALKEGKP